jgi:hypothetical protein
MTSSRNQAIAPTTPGLLGSETFVEQMSLFLRKKASLAMPATKAKSLLSLDGMASWLMEADAQIPDHVIDFGSNAVVLTHANTAMLQDCVLVQFVLGSSSTVESFCAVAGNLVPDAEIKKVSPLSKASIASDRANIPSLFESAPRNPASRARFKRAGSMCSKVNSKSGMPGLAL